MFVLGLELAPALELVAQAAGGPLVVAAELAQVDGVGRLDLRSRGSAVGAPAVGHQRLRAGGFSSCSDRCSAPPAATIFARPRLSFTRSPASW